MRVKITKAYDWAASSYWFFGFYILALYIIAQIVQKHLNFTPVSEYHFEFETNLFFPSTVWIYLTAYVMPAVCVIVSEKKYIKNLSIPCMVTQTVASLIFIFFPTACLRDSFPTANIEGLSAWVLELFRQFDDHSNSFPSTHVNITCLSMIWIYFANRKIFPLFLIWGIGIIVSTITTKQHHLIDVLGGILLAVICYALLGTEKTNQITSEQYENT